MVQPAHTYEPPISGKTQFTTKWLRFVWMSTTGKTDVWYVRAKDGDVLLGVIKWYGPFRAYSFFPQANCVFEKTCLGNITDFIVRLMDERKRAKEPRPTKVFYPLCDPKTDGTYYRIDNSGEVGVLVPGHGPKALWETQTEAIEMARLIYDHPANDWRKPVFEICKLDTSKGKVLSKTEVTFKPEQ